MKRNDQISLYQRKKLLLRFIIPFFILFGLLLGVLSGEILVRKLEQRESKNKLLLDERIITDDGIFSSRLLVTKKPHTRVANLLENSKTVFFYNSYGFRDYDWGYKKQKDVFRILTIGDSMTFGHGVEMYESYPKVLERELNKQTNTLRLFEVLNMSLPGWGTYQYLHVYEDVGKKFNPDLIIVGVFLGNDPLDTLYFHLNQRAITLKALPDTLLPYEINQSLKENSRLWLLLLQKYYTWEQTQEVDTKKLVLSSIPPLKRTRTLQIDEPVGYFQDAWKLSEENLNSLAKHATKDHIPLLIVIIPTREQVDQDAWQRAKANGHDIDERLYSNTVPRKIMQGMCQKNKWTCLDIQDVLRTQEDSNALYIGMDHHLSPLGHQVISNYLVEYFASKKYVE